MKKLSVWLLYSYPFALLVWFICRQLFSDTYWWLAILNSFALYLFTPSLFVTPLALALRERNSLVTLGIPVVLFVILFHEQLIPKPVTAFAAHNETLKVMTFNVNGGTPSAEPIINKIIAEAPDVVLLQELNTVHAAGLARALKVEYPYQALHPVDGIWGYGVLSRYPFQDFGKIELAGEPESGQRVELTWSDTRVQIITAHLAVTLLTLSPDEFATHVTESFRTREQQARELVALSQSFPSPTIVTCDCNTTDTTAAYSILRNGFQDAQHAASWGFAPTFPSDASFLNRWSHVFWKWLTFDNTPYRASPDDLRTTAGFPLLRLDYIFYSHHLLASSAYVSGWDGQSDHLPMVAVLHLAQ